MVFGDRRSVAEARLAPKPHGLEPPGDPRSVLRETLRPALERTPCLVSFSGGRDSSVVLAAATEAARIYALPEPIPITMRYPEQPRTWEADWQELTVEHLGLQQWEVVEIRDELDALGSIAKDALGRHGLYWPPNAHAMVPMLERAQGGSLVTGNGGDEIFSEWTLRRLWLIRRAKLLPAPSDLKYVAASYLPRKIRTALWRRRGSLYLPWLTEAGGRQLQHAWAERGAEFHSSWGEALNGLTRSRYLELASSIFEALAQERDVRLEQPFLDPRMISAVAWAFPREGPVSRSDALARYFSDLLPQEVLTRSTKASFTEILWGPAARAFAKAWDSDGLDPTLVDLRALRAEWALQRPDFRAVTPLQAAAARSA